MNIKKVILEQLEESRTVLEKIINEPAMIEQIQEAATSIASAIDNGNKVLSCGNGGSLCDAMHFAEEMSGRFREDRKPLPAIAITDPSYLTCTGNDYGFNSVFSRYVEALGKKGDILFAISTSGNSENIIEAVESARRMELSVIALTGGNGGRLADKANLSIIIPYEGYADRIQEMHIKIIHILVLLVEKLIK